MRYNVTSLLQQQSIAFFIDARFFVCQTVQISFQDKLIVETTEANYETENIILATGSPRATPRIAGIKELEGKGVSYCAVCDAFFYKGKDVAVLGTGEYAAHEIADLLPVAGTVTLLTNGIDASMDIPAGVVVNNAKVNAIKGIDRVEQVEFDDGSTIKADGVFIAYGVAGSTALARKIGAEIDGNKILVDENMATNIPGLYAAGDCTGGLLQISKAVYEGAKAGTEVVKRSRKGE